MRGHPGNLYAPRGQFHDDKNIIRHEAVPGGDLDREEISGGEDFPMELQKLRPAHARLPSLRGRLHMVTAQDIPYGDRVDGMPQVGQGTLNPSITPSSILLSHPDHELFDLLGHPRAPKRSAMPAPVECLGHEAVVPAQEGLGCRQRGHLFEALTPERVGERREASAFGLGQMQPSAPELSFEDAVFLAQIIDDLLLVILDPPGDYGDQNVKNHRRSSGWRQ
jgi:hypothetical protein